MLALILVHCLHVPTYVHTCCTCTCIIWLDLYNEQPYKYCEKTMCHPVLWSSPGMPEMLSPGGALVGAGLGTTVALLTDGRFSGASHGMYDLYSRPTCNLLVTIHNIQ